MALLALTRDPEPGQPSAVCVWSLPDDSAGLLTGLLTSMFGQPHEVLTDPATIERLTAAAGTGHWVLTTPPPAGPGPDGGGAD